MVETRCERWHREAQRHWIRDGLAAAAAVLIGWWAFTTVGSAACFADREPVREATVEMEVRDEYQPEEETQQTGIDEDGPEDPDPEEYGESDEYLYDDGSWESDEYYYAEQWEEYDMPTEGLTREGGVNYYGGRTETYYSSNVLYHYRTDEWTVDDEGFYRDSEGRYVVAASDMEQGTVFEGSKGECIVLDCGCDEGVTDYYVAW